LQPDGADMIDARAIRTAISTTNEKSNDLGFALDVVARRGADTDFLFSENARLDLLLDFEQQFINYFEPLRLAKPGSGHASGESFESTRLDFYASRSGDDILRSGNQAPVRLIAGGYSILVLYIVLSLANYSRPWGLHNAIFSRIGIGLAALLGLSIGTVASFGLVSFAGIELSPITTNVLPLVSLGIGLDDAFIVIAAVTAAGDSAELTSEKRDSKDSEKNNDDASRNPIDDNDNDVERRMKLALSRVGPSVILTSFSLVLGFLVASAVPIPAVKSFCHQLAATVAINLALLFLIFTPFCALDCRRVKQKRIDVLCISATTFSSQDESSVRQENECVDGTLGSAVSKFARKLGSLLFGSTGHTVSILALVAVFTGVCLAISIVKSKAGLPLETVALRGTYQREFLSIQESAFPVYGGFLVHAVRQNDADGVFAKAKVQQSMIRQTTALQKAFKTSPIPKIYDVGWFFNNSFSFLALHANVFGTNNSNAPILTEDEFRTTFATFVTTSGASFLSDLRCTSRAKRGNPVECDLSGRYPGEVAEGVDLTGSRVPFLQSDLQDTGTIVSALQSSRAAVARHAIDEVESFVYGYVYEFWEQYLGIYLSLAKVVALALLGLAIVTLFMLGSVRVAGLVVIVVLLITVQVFGVSTAIGVEVNSVSLSSTWLV
jgi:hypothetical protein